MRRLLILLLTTLLLLSAAITLPVFAQEEPASSNLPDLLLSTQYPSQTVGLGDTISLNLNLRSGNSPQVVNLAVQDLPEEWIATFRGGGRIVQSAFVEPESEATVELRLEPPVGVQPGTYDFVVFAQGEGAESELPIELTIEEKVPGSLAFEIELPVLRGRPNTTFRYDVTLKNEGDDDLTVNLLADAPPAFSVLFKSGTQEVTSLPVEANSTKRLSIEVDPLLSVVPAGAYPVTVRAQSGDLETAIDLVAEVVGQSSLTLATPDDRLSGEAEAGKETSFSLLVQNLGSAPATGVKMSASSPSGWSVTFEPEQIDQLEPGAVVEVAAKVVPSEQALAGDYEITYRAQPENGDTESVEYRVTVRTSTLWGIAGIVLIAVAVGAVGLAVSRFGRR